MPRKTETTFTTQELIDVATLLRFVADGIDTVRVGIEARGGDSIDVPYVSEISRTLSGTENFVANLRTAYAQSLRGKRVPQDAKKRARKTPTRGKKPKKT